ncbi:interleukin-32-like isoform 1-T1 [Dama dama]|uniref:interleukin-32 isoform X1 n=1 Tax=Dama dama TaxID=30532 RepID=UPI002A36CD13|nr:interleukin-32 isoform X1 [Dama dama]
MANAWGVPHDAASLRAQMHSRVDYLFDLLENQPGEAQGRLSEDIVEYLDVRIQANLPESQQESSPLLLEARPEVRHRIQRPSVSASLEVQNPEESIWARAWRRFLGFLQSLRQWCRDVLTWLREKAAAILEAICSAVEAVWGLLSGFSFSAGQLFGNLIQV